MTIAEFFDTVNFENDEIEVKLSIDRVFRRITDFYVKYRFTPVWFSRIDHIDMHDKRFIITAVLSEKVANGDYTLKPGEIIEASAPPVTLKYRVKEPRSYQMDDDKHLALIESITSAQEIKTIEKDIQINMLAGLNLYNYGDEINFNTADVHGSVLAQIPTIIDIKGLKK